MTFSVFFLSSSAQVIDLWVTWSHLAAFKIAQPPNGLAAPVFESDGVQDVTPLSPHLSHSGHIDCQLEEPALKQSAPSGGLSILLTRVHTAWPFKDTSITNLKTEQAVWVYYGSGLVD